MMKLYIVFGFIAFSAAYVVPEGYYEPEYYPADGYESERVARASPAELIFDEDLADEPEVEEPQYYIRTRRSLQPGAPNFPMPGSQLPTSITSNIEKQGPNTAATINAQHKTDRYDVGATWSKVIRGPGRSKPNWSIGGTYRW
uniref:Rhinocerosin n=2 Tax=Oryctes rhinoceros TaxID=72550 RepID=RHIC_ORYRH|nr:RecName: Full=Rhinocerosin; Flags: Precursor [Oryctes rhinoceros]QGX74966.1 rhinocerosin [Oryctes rhinoceros]BAA31506.1 rhinocerosin [Oryctes rhinoceros]